MKKQKKGKLKEGDWKKIRQKQKDNVITVKEETKIGDYILEKGDKIEVLKEVSSFQTASSDYIGNLIMTAGAETAGITAVDTIIDSVVRKMDDEEIDSFLLGMEQGIEKARRTY